MHLGNEWVLISAYIDESERDELYYFLGAVVCTPSQQAFLDAAFSQILHNYSKTFPSLHQGLELHGNEILAGRREWKNVPIRARFAIYDQALKAVANSGVCVHLEGIDITKQKQRYTWPTPARELALSHLLERIDECATRQQCNVDVFADEHHTKETSRSNFASYQAYGTYGYKSSRLRRINPTFEFIDSKNSSAMQAADLATYIYNRRKTIVEKDPRAVEQKTLLWSSLLPAVQRGNQRVWP